MTISDRDSSWLAALIAPLSADEFIAEYWSSRYLFCRGAPDRFASLLSWTDLNEILEHHWRETYRFRVALQGRDLEPASYADLDGDTPRVRPKDVTDYLRNGATLSFAAIDELHAPLTRVAESFEACFRGGTKINIYAGWRALHGLDLHRDNQEIFILQLDGRKRWLLYGFSIDHVDREELRRLSVPPAGAVLDQILEPGDLLYIPRGCYHVAVPMNEPALHLTIGVKVPRGRDVLAWMAGRAGADAVADRDIPTLTGSPDRLRFSNDLRDALAAGIAPDLVEQYLSDTGSNFKPRPSFSLPFSATPDGLPSGAAFVVRLNPPAPRRLNDDPEVAAVDWRCGARTCRFPRSMQRILDPLADGVPLPFSHLVAAAAGHLDEPSVRLLLGLLVRQNLVAIRPAAVQSR